MSYQDVCHCGHHKDSHYLGKHTCLGMLCDCEKYIHRDEPKPVKPVAPRKKPVDDWDLLTPTMIHPTWCTCPVCYIPGLP